MKTSSYRVVKLSAKNWEKNNLKFQSSTILTTYLIKKIHEIFLSKNLNLIMYFEVVNRAEII